MSVSRAASKLRLALSVRRLNVRAAYLDWEEAVHQFGRRFSVQQWRIRFRRSHKAWERLLKKGRGALGLEGLRFDVEKVGNCAPTHWLTLSDGDVDRLEFFRRMVEAFYLHGVKSDHSRAEVEGLERTAPLAEATRQCCSCGKFFGSVGGRKECGSCSQSASRHGRDESGKPLKQARCA